MKIIIPTMLAISLHASAAVSTSGLVNYWTFDGNGNDTAGDFFGNASAFESNAIIGDLDPDGTFAPSVSYSTEGSQIGGAAVFNRAANNTGGLIIGNNGDTDFTGQDLSISLWARFDEGDGEQDVAWQTLISNGEGENYRVAILNNTDRISASFGGGDTPNTGDQDLRDGEFHHIVAVGTNGGNLDIYVDGELRVSQTNPTDIEQQGGGGDATPQNPSGNLVIGNNPGSINRQWNGLIDDVGQFERVLTSEEITAIYEAGLNGNSLGSILVPEPSSTALIGLGSLALAFRRRR